MSEQSDKIPNKSANTAAAYETGDKLDDNKLFGTNDAYTSSASDLATSILNVLRNRHENLFSGPHIYSIAIIEPAGIQLSSDLLDQYGVSDDQVLDGYIYHKVLYTLDSTIAHSFLLKFLQAAKIVNVSASNEPGGSCAKLVTITG